MIHSLKCWPEYFQAIKAGVKTFEIRWDDRRYAVCDFLDLHEWNPVIEKFTDEQPIRVEVTYLLSGDMFLQYGMVCMAIRQSKEPCEWCSDGAKVFIRLERKLEFWSDKPEQFPSSCPSCGRLLESEDK